MTNVTEVNCHAFLKQTLFHISFKIFKQNIQLKCDLNEVKSYHFGCALGLIHICFALVKIRHLNATELFCGSGETVNDMCDEQPALP